MNIWALADLHLALGAPQKTMEVFGPQWADYTGKIERGWRAVVQPGDLVLIAGDISWAMSTEQAQVDLKWIHELPGTKVLIKGNHDYWWSSLSKVQQILPPSIHVIQNNIFSYQGIFIAGARLWDTQEYGFNACIDYKPNPLASTSKEEEPDPEKIFKRELERLELSLKDLPKDAPVRIAMTHYPPIGLDLQSSRASTLLEKYNVSLCIFGHLHNVKKENPLFGAARGVTYHLTSADYLDFQPLKIYSIP